MPTKHVCVCVCVSEFIYRSHWPLHEVFVARPAQVTLQGRKIKTPPRGPSIRPPPRCSWNRLAPSGKQPQVRPVCPPHWWSRYPTVPSPYRRDLWQVRASELSTINSG
ncbi:hypothetical protein DPMN_123580 [Dreissena polymorpha]|uniref:Uncharacterized protein n=1 Tax=Dreissena polymorpha TaxID=45954 RepID=A0A9D4JVH3_DREPO|nr:hypothetical protein DPMN_123580 [Dreissena polymorpha]